MDKLKKPIHPHRNSPSLSPRKWIIAFVVCNFNVDLGPEIELVYPPDVHFSTSDLSAICFNSFPERHDTEMHEDLCFQFSIHNGSPDIRLDSPCPPYGSPSELYGHCIFRQEYDHNTKRAFSQKSLVLISNHDFPAFYLDTLQKLTRSGLISDPNALEAACSQISSWLAPSVGKHELPFMGSLLMLEMYVTLYPLRKLV